MLFAAIVNLVNSSPSRSQTTPLAALIDHTLLKPEAAQPDIERLCQEALDYSFASVCINPLWVPFAAKRLQGQSPKVCTVIGFPLGATGIASKSFEAQWAIEHGATELDMVLAIGSLRFRNLSAVQAEIETVVAIAHAAGAITKVILETCLLTHDEKIIACQISRAAGAEFVKTSTGFSSGGATVDDVCLMRDVVGPDMGVKASGGIRDLLTMQSMVAAGATRIGASAGVAIMQQLENNTNASPLQAGADQY